MVAVLYVHHLEMKSLPCQGGVFTTCQEKWLPCCCLVRPFLLSKRSNVNKDRTTKIILLQNTHIHVARQRANANHSLSACTPSAGGSVLQEKFRGPVSTSCLSALGPGYLGTCLNVSHMLQGLLLKIYIVFWYCSPIVFCTAAQKNSSEPGLKSGLKFKHLLELKEDTSVMLRTYVQRRYSC